VAFRNQKEAGGIKSGWQYSGCMMLFISLEENGTNIYKHKAKYKK
jgi:hypothetical protein